MGKSFFLSFTFMLFTTCVFSQTMTELVVPEYMGSKTGTSVNHAKTPIAVCLEINGLLPNTAYDIRAGFGLISDTLNYWGVGNLWTGTGFSGNIDYNLFISDTSGNSGPFWLYLQPTGNSTRFDAGMIHNLRIGYRINGGTFGAGPDFISVNTITCLDIAVSPRTTTDSDDGAFVYGSALIPAGGKYVLLFNNLTGSGNPLFSYMIRQMIPTQTGPQTELPQPLDDVFAQGGASSAGDYPAVIPIGANNPDGVRRIEARNADNTLYAYNADSNGIWPSGTNTTTIQRREVVYITNADAPLTPCLPLAPLPDFVADDTTIMTGDSVNFFDSTQFCPDTWNWSFEGGTPATSDSQNPAGIVWNYPGSYTVCLTASNNWGTGTKCRFGYITVNIPVIPKIVITEIMYNPPESGTDSLEFIELYNNDTVAVNLQNFYFSEGVVYTFPDYLLSVHDHVLVSRNSAAITSTFGVPALQWTSGSLSNSGEQIRLKDSLHHTIDSVQYENGAPWDPGANGQGPSLELCDPDADNSLAQNWTHALEYATINNAGDTIWASPLSGCTSIPVADFYSGDTIIGVGDVAEFVDSSSGAITAWNWEFDGGSPPIFEGQVPPPVSYNTMGNFDVRLTVSNISGQDCRLKTGYIRVGITETNDNPRDNAILVSPNPNDGKFSVIWSGRSGFDIKIMSFDGILLIQKSGVGNEHKIDISCFDDGIYLLQASDFKTGIPIIKKIIIRRL